MSSLLIEAVLILGALCIAGYAALRAWADPRGAYLRIVLWTLAALAAAFGAILVLDAIADPAAGLGLFFILLALVGAILTVAALAAIAATLRLIRDALR